MVGGEEISPPLHMEDLRYPGEMVLSAQKTQASLKGVIVDSAVQ